MNESRCGVPEERWIDWHLRRLPPDTAKAMARHLPHCADCQRVSRQWQAWLGAGEGEGAGAVSQGWNEKPSAPSRSETESSEGEADAAWRRSEEPSAPSRSETESSEGEADASWRRNEEPSATPYGGRAGDGPSEAESLYPSERVYRSLRLQVIKRGLRSRAKRRSLWWVSGTAAMLLLLAGFAWRGWLTDGGIAQEAVALPPMTYAQLHVPEGAALMAQPDTKMIAVVPSGLPDAPGTLGKRTVMVWMNGRTMEMFVLFEGVLPAGSRDVQAWATIKRQQTNMGLLEFHHAQGHLYSQGSSLADLEELAFTIEPKGGSLRPTAPETARVKLAPDE